MICDVSVAMFILGSVSFLDMIINKGILSFYAHVSNRTALFVFISCNMFYHLSDKCSLTCMHCKHSFVIVCWVIKAGSEQLGFTVMCVCLIYISLFSLQMTGLLWRNTPVNTKQLRPLM